jgi:catechol 2,3-dioxygenase-like lactoylglutathione lyase family enzyme
MLEVHILPDVTLPHPKDGLHTGFLVDDLEAYRRLISNAGYDTFELTPIQNRPRFYCQDPFGNLLEFVKILKSERTTRRVIFGKT